MLRSLAFAFSFLSFSAWAQIEIEKPWMRATAPGAKVAAGYMVMRNTADNADRLVGASTTVSARVETHIHVKDGDILRMREVKGYDIPAKGRFELKPGGPHLMLIDLKQPLKEGDKVLVTLRFERAGEVKVEFQVTPLTAAPSHHKH